VLEVFEFLVVAFVRVPHRARLGGGIREGLIRRASPLRSLPIAEPPVHHACQREMGLAMPFDRVNTSLSFLRAIEQAEPVDLDTEGATHALVECH